MLHKLNKKAGEKIIAIWWFFVLILVAISIIGAVAMFFGADLNIKQVEAQFLYEKIFNCIKNNGVLNSWVFEEDFYFAKCSLNEKVFGKGSSLFASIDVYSNEDKQTIIKSIEIGNSGDLKVACNLEKESAKGARYFPIGAFFNHSLNMQDKGVLKEVFVEITACANQAGNQKNIYLKENLEGTK